MPKQSKTLTRRKFLKGAAYASALSIGAVSTALASVSSVRPQQGMTNGTSASTVTLLNQSNRSVVLNAAQPVSLEKVHGWVVVKINKVPQQDFAETSNSITLSAGQQRSFAIDSELAPALQETGGHIVITNEYSALDNMVPMATYDVVVV